MSGFASSRWYTFKQAKALDGHVRKGEHGTKITFWRFIQPKAKSAANNAKDQGDEDANGKTIPILRLWTIFNAEQIVWPEGSLHAPSRTWHKLYARWSVERDAGIEGTIPLEVAP